MGGETPKKVVVSWTAAEERGSRATRASATGWLFKTRNKY